MPYDTTFVKGRKTALFVYLLAAGAARVAPTPETITEGGAGASIGATSITVSAITNAIPKYTRLVFDVGGTPKEAFLTADAAPAATTLTVEPLEVAIDAGDTAEWNQLVRVQGGTSSGLQIGHNTENLQTSPYESDETPTWDDGVLRSLNWAIPWQGNFKPDDPGFKLCEQSALEGREIYLLYQIPREDGSIARKYTGFGAVQNMNSDNPSENIVTASWTNQGRGALTKTEVAAA